MLTKTPFKVLMSVCAVIMIGCTTVKMADIPSTAEPRDEIAKLDTEINFAMTKNIDVLAARDFRTSKTYLEKAKNELQKGKSQSDILDAVRAGRGSLVEAYSKAGDHEASAQGLFDARQMALKAGAGNFSELQSDLNNLDSKVSDQSDSLATTKADTLADFQKQYVDLERRAVILSQLGKTQAFLNGAAKDGAKRKAPVTFKKVELSLKNAESIISTNVRNADGYRAAVLQAKTDANQLSNVMGTIEQNGGNLAESTAIKMVAQNKALSGLEKNLSAVTAKGEADQAAMQVQNDKLASSQSATQMQNDKLAASKDAIQMENEKLALSQSAMKAENDKLASSNVSKDQALNTATSKVQMQRALESARSQFSAEEAEAYQQGDNLVIRLKQVNFASGKSDLPAGSLPLLAKVLDVAKSLNPNRIKVEGHTDSVGTIAGNKTISDSRASAVATYFKSNGFSDIAVESEGFGDKKPLASNKSKEGRAQNRRVDVTISPVQITK